MAALPDSDQLPLQGVVLCCTSLAQDVRTHIADMATHMGAIHLLDLTADVTHLLVGSITTPKYRYVAKERPDIKVLTPDFIPRLREAWIQGGEVDVQKYEAECKVKTFAGLEMCLTGFNDTTQRTEMQRTCQEQGAKWSADLTRHVTHLIAAKPEGAKYTHAKQWGITVVSLKWYEDSLMRGMAVDESYYACEIPREEQGVGAFRIVPKTTSLGKRAREDSQGARPTGESTRKKLRKSASMRLSEQSQDLWQSISQHEIQVDNTVVDAWTDSNSESQSLRDSNGPRMSVRHSDTTELMERHDPKESQGLFSGHFVLIHGFDATKTQKLRLVLAANGATVVSTPSDLEHASEQPFFRSRCLLMPHAQPTELPIVSPGTMLVTEWWVERCLHFKQQIHPDQDSLSQPLQDKRIADFAGLVISSTGFNSVDLRMSAETINLMGGTYEEQLTPSTSVLVCASVTMKKEKAYYASKYKIPVVRPEWLWESLKSRSKLPTELYSVDLSRYDFSQFTTQSANTPAASDRASARGIGSAVNRGEEVVHPKRLSKTRRRQQTPSLMLKPAATGHTAPAKSRPPPCPFVLEDEDDGDDDEATPAVSNRDSRDKTTAQASDPLRELCSNASQGSRQIDGPTKDSQTLDNAQSHSSPQSPQRSRSPAKEAQKLASDLCALVRRRDGSGQDATTERPRRKQRTLGRNLSGTSMTHLTAQQKSMSGSPAIMEEGCEADGFAPSREPVAPPGTQLEYGEGSGKTVSSMGTLKDSEDMKRSLCTGAAAAAGGRTKSRARTKM